MMKFDEYWQKRVKANPGLANEQATMKITVAAFKRQIENAYNAGKVADDSLGSRLDGVFDSFDKVLRK